MHKAAGQSTGVQFIGANDSIVTALDYVGDSAARRHRFICQNDEHGNGRAGNLAMGIGRARVASRISALIRSAMYVAHVPARQ